MRAKILTSAAAVAFVVPFAGCAPSDIARGPAGGAVGDARVPAPVDAGGAIVGGIAAQNKPKFKEYVAKQHHPSLSYTGEVVAGADLPLSGIPLYTVPSEYGATTYRYTIINYITVLVDPFSHKIVDVIY